MAISISDSVLATFLVAEGSYYFPPRKTVALFDTDYENDPVMDLPAWTEVQLSFENLRLENGTEPTLLLSRVPGNGRQKDRKHFKERDPFEHLSIKTIIFTELRQGDYVAFIPPGTYPSIEFGFYDGGGSFSSLKISSRTPTHIVASKSFYASAAKRSIDLLRKPNPETVRRLKKTRDSVLSLILSVKDDLAGVKPPEEIPDGPYTLQEYDIWFSKNCTIGKKEDLLAQYYVSTFSSKPLVSVVLAVHDPDVKYLAASIHSVLGQIYHQFELVISDNGHCSQEVRNYLVDLERRDPRLKVLLSDEKVGIPEAVNRAIDISSGEYVAFLEQDDLLNRDALFWMVEKLNEWPTADLIYSDEDAIDSDQALTLPHFKSDWNLLLLLSYNYVGHLVMVKSSIAKIIKLREIAQDTYMHDFLLRTSLQIDEDNIKHVPRILYHSRLDNDPLNVGATGHKLDYTSRKMVVQDFLDQWRPGAEVETHPNTFFNRIHFPVSDPAPKVAIVIPTRDAPEVLERCVNSVLNFTEYSDYEINVIDNGSVETRTKQLFTELERTGRVKVHSYDHPFNFAQMHNWLIEQLDADLVCLLNNDTEVIEGNWLKELVSLVSLPGFAVAGSMLLYPDRSIQHAGIALGIGNIAIHLGTGELPDNPGYFGRNLMAQELSAVTAAALLIKRSAYIEVGGMNAERLPVSFNDVDLCLKVRAAKYKIAWTPYSRLIHFESKSRGIDHEDDYKRLRSAGELSYCALTWRSEILNDPYYNQNFDLESEPFEMLASVPRLELTLKPGVKT